MNMVGHFVGNNKTYNSHTPGKKVLFCGCLCLTEIVVLRDVESGAMQLPKH